jgi:Macrocin-O-methyltransferase (TylF).
MKTIYQEPDEIETLHLELRKIKNVEGDLTEVGVWKGGSAKIIREIIPDKTLYLFDTFTGIPDDVIEEDKPHGQYFGACQADESFVQELKLPNTIIVKGVFPETSDIIKDKKFSFVHIDVDIYKATKDSLEFLFPKLVQEGTMIIHDYPMYAGVKRAVDEYFLDKKIKTSQCGIRQLIIKKC